MSAFLIALGVLGPARFVLRRATWPLERRGWARLVAGSVDRPWVCSTGCCAPIWSGARIWIRFHQMRDSLPFVFERGLQMGLPVVAVAVATVPIWGMSWYFNSENWAAAICNSWAEHRTDTWRVAMTRSVSASTAAADPAGALALSPPELGRDFAFLVIGDPGEGDALPARAARPDHPGGAGADVRFMVISSDVIYPHRGDEGLRGELLAAVQGIRQARLRDSGQPRLVRRPRRLRGHVLHARGGRGRHAGAGRGRQPIDQHDRRPDRVADRRSGAAARASTACPPGSSRRPTSRSRPTASPSSRSTPACSGASILTSSRGSARRSTVRRGKFKMVVLGHPLYSGGCTRPPAMPDFTAIHELLREHRVDLVMAGDTHDLELYLERYQAAGTDRVMHHVVNGGGGAYLSSGTALAWPASARRAAVGVPSRAPRR